MEYEIIKGWLNDKFSEELIIAALKEAVYNGATNLRYIDKVLYEWNRKGYKSINDINNRYNEDNYNENLFDTSILKFDWLNVNDK